MEGTFLDVRWVRMKRYKSAPRGCNRKVCIDIQLITKVHRRREADARQVEIMPQK
jgi:hypothetical protein